MDTGKHKGGEILGWLFRQARSAMAWIALSVGLGFFSGLLLIAQAYLTAQIIHGATLEAQTRSALTPIFACIAGLIGVRAFLAWWRETAAFRASAAIRHDVRMTLVAHIHRLGPAYLAGQKTGALSSTAMEQVEGLHGFFAHYLPQLALALMVPLAILFVVFPVSWAAGGLLLITAPLIPLFMMLIGMGAESVSQRHFEALSRMSAHFLDTLVGLPTLKLFDRSRSEAKAVGRVSAAYRQRTMNILKIAFLSSAVLEFLSSLAIALVAVFLGMTLLGYYHFGTWGQPLTLSGAFLILLLAPEFFLPLRELGTHYHARAEAMGASAEIRKILKVPVPAAARSVRPFHDTGRLEIAFENVGLAYEGGRRTGVSDVSFAIGAGEKRFLVGESGAGKTTLIHLLLGFRQPDHGRICVNGEPLDRFDVESWRRQVAWIGQQPVLLPGTIRDNIRMGRHDASDAEIRRAADWALVSDFSDRMAAGLDTRVGERGYGLSRGQAQRVALARAFVKDAPVLLLDEPTAGLDAENERRINGVLVELARNRTVLTATHRLAGLTPSDRVIVLSGGSIVQQGRYAELSASHGPLRQLLRRQEGSGEHDG